jgi:hypothetical protein
MNISNDLMEGNELLTSSSGHLQPILAQQKTHKPRREEIVVGARVGAPNPKPLGFCNIG